MLVQSDDLVPMSTESAVFELDQAYCHLRDLWAHMTGKQAIDDYALSIRFGHVLCHFNMAWHELAEVFDHTSPVKSVSWDTHSQIIPQLDDTFRLLPGLYVGERPAAFPKIGLSRTILRKVLVSTASLIKELSSTSMVISQETCRKRFSRLIEGLNTAWHALREDGDSLRECRKLTPNYFFEMQIQ